jgi:UDP-N-acetylglucosamine--N-acetylmuramyl-(pentapeptide) pyrophosphoryl-undecaprenol N-acetylglucosamine transferase
MKKIFIAGGGTGGHLYPGLAIARALQKLDSDVEIHFVGTAQGLETKIIPKEKLPLHLIEGGKLNFSGSPWLKMKTLIKLPIGFFQSLALLVKYRPQFVLGVGGYASGPFLLAAAILRKQTAIWEPNVYPGMTNRWLARFVQSCFLVFEESKKLLQHPNSKVFGMPVRAEMESHSQSTESQRKDAKFHLLHLGGSQGSRAIGRALCTAIQQGGEWVQELKVVHQTGSLDHKDFLERYKGFEAIVDVHEFIYNMPDFYQWADLVVCRGGAGTLNELAAFGLPAIVIPLPAADGHQEHNAQMLVQGEAARMIVQKDLTPERLIEEIQKLRQDPALREKMRQNVHRFHRPRAAEAIAKAILESVAKADLET